MLVKYEKRDCILAKGEMNRTNRGGNAVRVGAGYKKTAELAEVCSSVLALG